MDTVFRFIGAAVVFWFLVGLVMSCFVRTYTQPGTPIHVRIIGRVAMAFSLPWLFINVGSLPKNAIMMDDTPEAMEAFKRWAGDCDCPKCRARRGEKV